MVFKMGILNTYICPKPNCPNIQQGNKNTHCPECGEKITKISTIEANKILKMKKGIGKGEKYVLFSDEMSNTDIRNKIYVDMANLSMQEAGTKWMHMGSLLSLNSRDQIIASGLKALIDQNKLIIRQNELLLRELNKLNKTK